MPARRTATTKRRLPYALDALESISSRGVGSASAEEPDLLPTHNPAVSDILALALALALAPSPSP